MTIKQLQAELQKLLELGCGDYDIRLVVQDYYSKYGAETTFEPKTVINSTTSGVYINNNAQWVTLEASLKTVDGKNPKITYRN